MDAYTDFLVDTGNPAALDYTLSNLHGALAVVLGAPDYIQKDGHYVMRVFGDPGYVKFACEHQGYCKIVRQLSESV